MRNKPLKIAVIIALSFLFAMLIEVETSPVAYAQFDGFPYEPPTVTVLSPLPNATIRTRDVPLNVTVQIFGFVYKNIERIDSLNYSLDGGVAVPMTLSIPSDLKPGYYVQGSSVLTGLSDGTHNLTIYIATRISGLKENFSTTVSFSVDTSIKQVQEPFPTVQVIAILLSITVLVSILFYLKHKKR